MSSAVPEGWSQSNIGKCCVILDSQRVPLNSGERANRKGDFPYYGANGIQGYIDDYIFEGEAILVAEDGGNFDQFADRPIAQWVTGKYWVNNHAHILRSEGSETNKWVFYSLVHKNILNYINGGTRAKLNQSDLREIEILSPPLPEQKKIASILTSVDEVIERTQKQIGKLQDLKKATMNELLTKGIGHTEFKDSELGRIPKSWEVKSLSALAYYRNGRAFKPSDWSKRGLPILRITQINSPGDIGDYFDGDDVEYKHFIQKGDLIFSWSATLKAIIWKDYDAVLNQHIFKVEERSNTSRIYLQQLLEHSIPTLLESSHGSTMQHIRKGVLDEFQVAVPSLPEQKKIASILTSIDEVIEHTQKQIGTLQSLKKSLMQDLLTGKVRVKVD